MFPQPNKPRKESSANGLRMSTPLESVGKFESWRVETHNLNALKKFIANNF